jgi:hypothetical protein
LGTERERYCCELCEARDAKLTMEKYRHWNGIMFTAA